MDSLQADKASFLSKSRTEFFMVADALDALGSTEILPRKIHSMPLRFFWRVHGRAKIPAKVFLSERIQIRTLFAFGSFRRDLIPREAQWL
jgi:hypothetical protein